MKPALVTADVFACTNPPGQFSAESVVCLKTINPGFSLAHVSVKFILITASHLSPPLIHSSCAEVQKRLTLSADSLCIGILVLCLEHSERSPTHGLWFEVHVILLEENSEKGEERTSGPHPV